MDRALVLLAVATTAAAVAFVVEVGRYYLLPLWERPDSPLHRLFRPSGAIGHGLGIAGTALMVVGIALLSSRKRLGFMHGLGPMRTWLNAHIYLCLAGPLMLTFHSALKFHSLAAYSYWSMMIVAGSGIVGRWLYQQFPRTIRGKEMTLEEVKEEQALAKELLSRAHEHAPAALAAAEHFANREVARIRSRGGVTLPWLFAEDLARPFRLAALRRRLVRIGRLPVVEARAIVELVRSQVVTARRLAFLGLFRKLFLYWHVTHLIFFVAMLVFMVLHVGTAIYFGAAMVGG